MTELLRCEGLTVFFGGLRALDCFDLSIATGEAIGLIGPNGSGKTTFFNALTGLVPIRGGHIKFDGHNITGLSPRRIYDRGITRTFQRSRLCLELTVFDNVIMGDQRELTLGVTSNLLRRARFNRELKLGVETVEALLSNFGHELVSRMFEPAGALKLVDRRRVEVCRSLISAPRLVLLDEPSAGMTIDEMRAFMDDVLRIRQHRPDTSLVLIEHEMDAIERVSDRCVVLDYGKKVADGAYADVIVDPWVQQAYLGEA